MVALLASRVPNLEGDDLAVYVNFFVRKISAYGRLEIISEFGLLEHLNQTGLAHSRVANRYNFDKALLLNRRGFRFRLSVLLCWFLIFLHFQIN